MLKCMNCGADQARSTARYCMACGARVAPLAKGNTLQQGAYTVDRPLAKGGMGAVYLARDTRTFERLGVDRPCVIKEMLAYFDPADPTEVTKARKRFEDEGRALASLSHSGIPTIYAYFSESGRNYIVMEYIEGEDLETRVTHHDSQDRLVKGKPLSQEKVITYAIEICKVLEWLCRQRKPVIHCDIKPANIIVDKNSGNARLVDFGTAKAKFVKQPTGQVGLQKSSVYGTAGYAAPEQYEAKSEPRSDVYALAATMYHLLTDDDPRGHPLDFPQLASLPAGIRNVLSKALEPDPKKRHTAFELRRELEALQTAFSLTAIAKSFHFRSGERARDTSELARLCEAKWDEAKEYLYQGNLQQWLSGALFRSDLADQAEKIRQKSGDQDVGLETFLHVLDPRLPVPALSTSPSRIRFGTLNPGEDRQKQLSIKNKAGRGYFAGTITTDPPAQWLKVPSSFTGETTLALTADTRGLTEGNNYRTTLRVTNAYDRSDKVEVPVTLRVAFPWQRVLKQMSILGFIGSLVGLLVAHFMAESSEKVLNGAFLMASSLPALIVGLARGIKGKRSFRGFLTRFVVGSLLAFLGLNYLSYVLALQCLSFSKHLEETGVYLAFAIVGLAVGLALGAFRGLKHIQRKVASLLVPVIIAALPVAVSLAAELATPAVAEYCPVQDVSIPVVYLAWGGEPLPTPTPPATPAATPTPTRTRVPTRTPTATRRATPAHRTPTVTRRIIAPGTITYTVQAGDTLGKIAKEFGVTVKAIAEANDIKDPDRLSIGQVLVIPEGP